MDEERCFFFFFLGFFATLDSPKKIDESYLPFNPDRLMTHMGGTHLNRMPGKELYFFHLKRAIIFEEIMLRNEDDRLQKTK